MTDAQWKVFFTICAGILGRGSFSPALSQSWCGWTTFGRLVSDAGYWTSGFPNVEDIGEHNTRDSGVWGQPFLYKDLAHIIIPKKFFWESTSDNGYDSGEKFQPIDLLAESLRKQGISFRLTDIVLEVRLY